MYAVIALGGKQYKVNPGERITVDRLPLDVDATFSPTVLLAADGDTIVHAADALAAVSVEATVLSHGKGKKITVQTYKPTTGYRRRKGHRSHQTVVEITKIAL
jgi:large subunit ribosomal protein L21